MILSTVPHHRTDLILRKVDLDRYDDRDLVRTNLIDSYDRIIAFVQKHLPDPFHLEGIERMSLRDTIFREVASNLLIHREYTNAFPAKLIIEYGQVRTENANIPHGFGLLNPQTLRPFPKNPIIGAFFREIHRADELGSGTRKLMKYGKIYGSADPEMIEGDIFETIIKVPEYTSASISSTEEVVINTDGSIYTHISRPESRPESNEYLETKLESKIAAKIILALSGQELSTSELVHILSHQTVSGEFKKQMARLRTQNLIEKTISANPKSRLQKYRLTPKGVGVLQNFKEKH